MGPGLPGQRSVLDADDRVFTEQAWGLAPGSLRSDANTGTVDLFREMQTGTIKASWIICTNPAASVPNRANVIAGLQACDLVITQDVFAETETNACADVLLPAALWAESTYVAVNSERNLTLLQQAADPVGEALPDWRIIDVACAMGYTDAFDYASSEEVFDELRQFWNPKTGYDLRGVSYARLARTPVQWPAPPVDPDGGADDGRNPIRYLNDGVSQQPLERPDGVRPRFAFATPNGRAVFFARPHVDPAELADPDYPFVLNTGRVQHQWHTLTKTGKVAKLNKLAIRGLSSRCTPTTRPGWTSTTATRSRWCRAAAGGAAGGGHRPRPTRQPVRALPLERRIRREPGGHAVTNDAVDPVSFQPEFKVAAVTLAKVAVALEPLARNEGSGPTDRSGSVTAGLGLTRAEPPTPSAEQSHYLQGLLCWALDTRAYAEPARLPASAPFDPATRAWLDGMIAGLTDHWPPPRCFRAKRTTASQGRRACGRPRPAMPRITPATTPSGCARPGSPWSSPAWTTSSPPDCPRPGLCC